VVHIDLDRDVVVNRILTCRIREVFPSQVCIRLDVTGGFSEGKPLYFTVKLFKGSIGGIALAENSLLPIYSCRDLARACRTAVVRAGLLKVVVLTGQRVK
jgi:hypothetical protein